jgi:hypothetical protein
MIDQLQNCRHCGKPILRTRNSRMAWHNTMRHTAIRRWNEAQAVAWFRATGMTVEPKAKAS